MLENLTAELALPADGRVRIAAAAGGNPLFVEQMSAMAAGTGGDVAAPPSIQALLAERLDRLDPAERDVVERAAVVGRDFAVAAVTALYPEEERPLLASRLFALARGGLVQPDPSPPSGEARFSFQHVLVRDAAYDAIPKQLRADLHERLAGWLASVPEPDEIVGYHVEQAYLYCGAVGPVDERTELLRTRAAGLLGAAGRRALARNDLYAALNLLDRAIALGAGELALSLDHVQALLLSGQLPAAAAAAEAVEQRAFASGDEVGALRSRLLRARVAAQLPPEDGTAREPSAELLAVAEEARPVFARAGDDLALAEAWFATAFVNLIRCRWGPMLEAVERSAEHTRRAGPAQWEAELGVWQSTAMFYGPTFVDDALRWHESRPTRHPIPLSQRAMLEAMREDFGRARALADAADTAANEFGQHLYLASGGMARWEIETLAGDVAAAERAIRRSCELLEELGDVGYRGNALSQRASSLCALGQLGEAESLSRLAEELSPPDDAASQMLWRQVRARVLARRGWHAEAQRLAAAAVALAEQTDMVNFHAEALADLAEVHGLAGNVQEANDLFSRALDRFEQKGNRAALRRVALSRAQLASGAVVS
jgi:tetratricopeptide (TPR) repeat protein